MKHFMAPNKKILKDIIAKFITEPVSDSLPVSASPALLALDAALLHFTHWMRHSCTARTGCGTPALHALDAEQSVRQHRKCLRRQCYALRRI